MKTILNISLSLFFICMAHMTWAQIGLSVEEGTNVTLSNGTGYFLVGNESSNNLIFDDNEIQSRIGGHPTSILFNFRGGDVFIGSSVGQSNLLIADYTRLGNNAPAIQTKLIEGTTTTGVSTVAIDHGIADHTKILSAYVIGGSGSSLLVSPVGTISQTQLLLSTALPSNSVFKAYITYMQ